MQFKIDKIIIERKKEEIELMLKIGDKSPKFDVLTSSGEKINSEELKGSKFVLYFYPRDSTPGCIKEACSIRDNYHYFQNNGIKVFGASGGSVKSHEKFIEKQKLPFPLLMDEKLDLAKKFYAYKRGNRVTRITYLIDEYGIIEGIFGGQGTEKVNTSTHANQILNFWKLN